MKKRILGYSLGPLGASVIGLLSVPLLSWVFPPADVGRFAMIQVVLNLSGLMFSFGLDQAYIRNYHQTKNKLDLFYLCYMPGAATLLFTLLVLFYEGTIYRFLFDIPHSQLSVFFYLTLFLFFTVKLFSIVVRMKERAFIYSLVQIIPKLSLVLFILFIYLFLPVNFDTLLISVFLSYLSTVILLITINRTEFLSLIRVYFDKEHLINLFTFGLPLILGGVAYWGVVASDRFFIKHFNGLDEVATYSVAASIAGGASVFAGVFNTIWGPMVFKWDAENQINTKKVESVMQGVLAAVLLIISLAGMTSWLLSYLLPENYLAVVILVPVLLLSPLLYTVAEVSSIGINLTRKTHYSLYATLASLFTCLILNYILVPIQGAVGAAISTLIAFNVYLGMRTYFSDRIWYVLKKDKFYFPMVVVNVSVLISCFISEFRVFIGVYFILLVFTVVYYRCVFRQVFNFLTQKHIAL